jgi:hypothetical protein
MGGLVLAEQKQAMHEAFDPELGVGMLLLQPLRFPSGDARAVLTIFIAPPLVTHEQIDEMMTLIRRC